MLLPRSLCELCAAAASSSPSSSSSSSSSAGHSVRIMGPNIVALNMCSLCCVHCPTESLKDKGWLGSCATRLRTLVLSNNNLTSIPDVSRLSSLTYLDLSHNHFKNTDKLLSLQQLVELDVSYNMLKSLLTMRTLSLNTNLKVLRVHPNPVTYTDRYPRRSTLCSLTDSLTQSLTHSLTH